MKTRYASCLAFTTVLALPTSAETIEVRTNDNKWRLHIAAELSPQVGEPFPLKVDVSPDEVVKGCPSLEQIIFDMPQHGHGSDYASTIESRSRCAWRVRGLTPTMTGIWRVRLVLAYDTVTTLAEIYIQVK